MNDFGQTSGAIDNRQMVTVNLGSNTAKDIATGTYHACAVLTGGAVKCWGANGNYQTGGSDVNSEAMVDVNLGSSTATNIVAGNAHTCVLLTGGAVKCWGMNSYGQTSGTQIQNLGLVGGNKGRSKDLTEIALGSNTVKDIIANHQTNCVLLNTGAIKCWGDNTEGSTSSTDVNTTSIVDVPLGGSTATHLSMGSTSCAVLASGVVKCWGAKDIGGNIYVPYIKDIDLGQDESSQARRAENIAAGDGFACALLDNGQDTNGDEKDKDIKCWGNIPQ